MIISKKNIKITEIVGLIAGLTTIFFTVRNHYFKPSTTTETPTGDNSSTGSGGDGNVGSRLVNDNTIPITVPIIKKSITPVPVTAKNLIIKPFAPIVPVVPKIIAQKKIINSVSFNGGQNQIL